MPAISVHPSVHPEISIHTEGNKPETAGSGGSFRTAPVSVAERLAFPTSPPAGTSNGLLSHSTKVGTYINVKFPGRSRTYYLDKSAKGVGGRHQLYTRDLRTGVIKQTKDQAVSDGQGGWKLDNGMPGGSDREPLLGGKPKKDPAWSSKRSGDKDASASSSKTNIPYKPLLPPKSSADRAMVKAALLEKALTDYGMS
jgi:hypothetical protein